MAEVSTVVQQPPEFIEAAAKPYITQLQQVTGALSQADLSKIFGPQFVAGLSPLQQQAQSTALAGIGGYKPFLQAAAASAGPNAYKQFMSPYQQDVIDTTLQGFDVQAQKGAQGVPAAAIAAGAFGGGREGVQRAEYQSSSDRNRAGLQAQLQQQGFQQAQQLAQQNIGNQLQLGQAGQAFLGQDVGALSTLGGINQAQLQAQLSAQQQLLQQQLNQPLQATQALGSGITGLIAGYPGSTQTQMQPSPTALQTALGAGATLAGVYRAFS
tara:strand:- start:573 stop:1379 length:807 start_codon:yes stop_codon:yes gene_type:complete